MVRDLNGLIGDFLKQTGAIIPAKNTDFDPKVPMPPVGKPGKKPPANKRPKTTGLRLELERSSDAESY